MPGLQEEMLELMMKAEKLGAGNDFEHRVTDSAQKIFESAKESGADERLIRQLSFVYRQQRGERALLELQLRQ